jgi:hypothetical protein
VQNKSTEKPKTCMLLQLVQAKLYLRNTHAFDINARIKIFFGLWFLQIYRKNLGSDAVL